MSVPATNRASIPSVRGKEDGHHELAQNPEGFTAFGVTPLVSASSLKTFNQRTGCASKNS